MEEFILEIVSMPVTWIMGILGSLTVAGLFIPAVRDVISWRLFGRKVDTAVENVKENTDCSIRDAMEGVKMSAEDRSRLNAAIDASNAKYTTLEGENKKLQTKLSEKRSGRYGSIENTMEGMGETLVDFQNKLDTFQHIVDDNRVLMTAMNHQMEVQPHKDNEILEVLTEVLRSVEDTNRLMENMTIENKKINEIPEKYLRDLAELDEAVSETTIGRQSDDYRAEQNKPRDTAIFRYDELTDRWLDEYDIQVCMSAIDGAAGMMLGVWSEEAGRYVSIYSPEWHKTVEWIASAEDLALSQKCHDEVIASGDSKFSGHDRNDPRIARYEWA